MEIYEPKEDSYFLSETIKDYLKDKLKYIKILDMGSGSGIQAETCRNLGFKDISSADINPDAIKLLKQMGFRSVHSNLFSKINKNKRFDLIIFNPPYLPEDKYDRKKDTTGGKKGFEIILKFLKQAESHLNKKGEILLLISSFSSPEIIRKETLGLGYSMIQIASKKLFFEELFVYELSLKE